MRNSLFPRSLLLAVIVLAMPIASSAGIIFEIGIAPPPLPVYVQPVCPGEGYIWVPGYWAYGDDGYFWVPGTWVLAPEPGLLWTPGYWGWGDGEFVFHQGYWGAQVGFYGGIDYGFGYSGVGYQGGYWNNGAFFYNQSVNNVTNITNVYNKAVVSSRTANSVSYNGGPGGISARPTAQEEAAARGRHIPPTSLQTRHVQDASTNRQLYESQNHGRPAIAATARPAQFSGRGVVAARAAAASYRPATARSHATVGRNRAPATRTEARPAERTTPRTEARPTERTAPRTEAHPAAPRTEARPTERTTPQRATPPPARPEKPATKASPQREPAPAEHKAPPKGEKETKSTKG